MVVDVKNRVCDGHLFKWLTAAGLAWLEHNQEIVNQMNVFPVPDGDTGINMRLTMQRAYDEIARLDEGHVGIVSEYVAKGALKGARGNSGVILSQLLHGFAKELHGHEIIDAQMFVRACQRAVDAAYNAVMQPVEGTILTVARQGMESLAKFVETNHDLYAAFEHLVMVSRSALENTPNLLPVLKKAGVVDSGGQGLVFILEGMARLLRGEPVFMGEADMAKIKGNGWEQALIPEDEEGYGYDVQFLMHGTNLDVDGVRAAINAMGWSTLVVGDSQLIKVHVHVHDPGQPLTYAIKMADWIDDIVVENMQEQYEQYVEDRHARENPPEVDADGVAVIAVVSGSGLEGMFYNDLQAARVISGGQTMNPSAEHFLSAIDSLPNEEIILLPNNKNIILAAQQAASLARDKRIHVVPTTTIPQGINAMLAYIDTHEDSDLDYIAAAMDEALKQVTTGEVTTATRDVSLDDVEVRKGQIIGLLDDVLVVAGDEIGDVVRRLLQKAGADEHELITLYYGDGVNESQAQALIEALAADFPGQQFQSIDGGQPLYPYIISVE